MITLSLMLPPVLPLYTGGSILTLPPPRPTSIYAVGVMVMHGILPRYMSPNTHPGPSWRYMYGNYYPPAYTYTCTYTYAYTYAYAHACA